MSQADRKAMIDLQRQVDKLQRRLVSVVARPDDPVRRRVAIVRLVADQGDGFFEAEEIRVDRDGKVVEPTAAEPQPLRAFDMNQLAGGSSNLAVGEDAIHLAAEIVTVNPDTGNSTGEPVFAIAGGAGVKLVRITGSTSIGDNRWSYSWEAVVGNEEATDPGTFKAVPEPQTGTAYNGLEAGNTVSGVQGCGINVDNLPSGWAIQPIGPGAVVSLRWVTDCSDPPADPGGWWQFEASNNADGVCS